jgi:hypothetical protein
MVELKVRKIGNPLGVVLPKEVIQQYLIEAPDGEYRLTAYDPDFGKKMAQAEDIIGRYRNTLRVLGK